jgi:hypothetical protein
MSNHDHGFSATDWTFPDPQNVAAICCRHILEGHPVLRVSHDEDDGCWQILCGSSHTGNEAKIVCLGCMVKCDPSLLALSDLPLGWGRQPKRQQRSMDENLQFGVKGNEPPWPTQPGA